MTRSRLCLNEMTFHANFGWHEVEHHTGGKYTVNVCFNWEINSDEKIESLDQTVDYEMVYLEVKKIMESRIRLIEEAARQILQLLKQMFSHLVLSIEVTVTKWNPPIGNTKSSSITYID